MIKERQYKSILYFHYRNREYHLRQLLLDNSTHGERSKHRMWLGTLGLLETWDMLK